MNTTTGLTDEEQRVMDDLVQAWNRFGALESTHPTERKDFANSIHRCQSLLGLRVLRREHPEGWKTRS